MVPAELSAHVTYTLWAPSTAIAGNSLSWRSKVSVRMTVLDAKVPPSFDAATMIACAVLRPTVRSYGPRSSPTTYSDPSDGSTATPAVWAILESKTEWTNVSPPSLETSMFAAVLFVPVLDPEMVV